MILEGKKLLKASKAFGVKFTTKLEDDITIYAFDKIGNNVYEINIVKDKRTSDKYFIKSEIFGKTKFIANGSVQAIFFCPMIMAKIGTSIKSKDNIYFIVDDNIDLYE